MKRGMSLAEVLICLAIIGMIVVLTIPNTIINAQKQARLAQAKKIYDSLNKVYEYAIQEDGFIIGTCGDINSPTNRRCPTNEDGDKFIVPNKHFVGGDISNLSDLYKKMFFNNMKAKDFSKTDNTFAFQTADGTKLEFTHNGSLDCSYTDQDPATILNNITETNWANSPYICFRVLVDLNGDASPNEITDLGDLANKNYKDRFVLYGFKTTINYPNSYEVVFSNDNSSAAAGQVNN